MQRLWIGAALALALAGCRSGQESTERTGGGAGERAVLRPWIRAAEGGHDLLGAPYAGYPGPVGPVGAEVVDAGGAAEIGAGAPALTPPSTAMPGARPFYPPDAGAAR